MIVSRFALTADTRNFSEISALALNFRFPSSVFRPNSKYANELSRPKIAGAGP